MRQFYLTIQKGATLSHQLTWSHYVEILKINDSNKINYYIAITINENLSVRELRERIKNNEYDRLDNNTKNKLITKEETTITDFIKNPIIIKTNGRKISNEKILKMIILENLDIFLKELGPSFSYIGNEYRIKIGNNYNYIDLLLFNIEFNSYVVIELKTTKLKKEHLGQIQVYMNYIDKNLKKAHHNKTIGIIICKYDNKFLIEYCSDSRIFTTKYIES